MLIRWRTCACAALIGSVASLPADAQMVLNPGSNTYLTLRGTDNAVDIDIDAITSLPAGGTLTPTALDATATADYAVSQAGTVVSGVEYVLGAAGGVSTAADLNGQIFFTPAVDLPWTLSGSFAWSGMWANGVSLFARIIDMSSMTDVTLHNYGSNGVLTNVSLTIGAGGGNFINTIGPVSGTLLAGHPYQFVYELAADSNQFSPESGTATGSVTLALLPEPSTGVLLLVALAGLSRRR